MLEHISDKFACLGIVGDCLYNPAHPYAIYLNVGNAISALGFTLAIQQFLKPIYRFRLHVHGIKLLYLLLAIFLGFLCSLIAALLPNLNISHNSFIEYPIVWELTGGLLIASVYLVTAAIAFRSARIFKFNTTIFSRAAADLLSKADDADRVSFAEDFVHNFEQLIKYAQAFSRAERSAVHIEFERLRAIGAPQQITGRIPISAFYAFSHRHELKRAAYTGTLLRIVSDPYFCSALVRKCPWLIANLLKKITEKRLHSDQAESFIQEIAHQAIANEESMMTREINYTGFATVPLLTESLFGNWFILSHYRPLAQLSFDNSRQATEGYVARLNAASEAMLQTTIKSGEWWDSRCVYGIEQAYENLFRHLNLKRYSGQKADFSVRLHIGISNLHRITTEGLESLSSERKKHLFITNPKQHRNDLTHTIASILYESFASIANSFKGHEDENWSHATELYDIYPIHGNYPAGMDALQQQLAIQLIDKLKHNMEGWYPAISRVLLATIGHYREAPEGTPRTAYMILQDAVYKELQKLPALYSSKSDRFLDFLPNNVTYDHATNTLSHRYFGGETKETNLSALTIPDVNLLDDSNWRF